jgi:hypothetical protein
MDNLALAREDTELLRETIRHTGKDPTALARDIGVAPSTLSRRLRNSNWKFRMAVKTREALLEMLGRPGVPERVARQWPRLSGDKQEIIMDLIDKLAGEEPPAPPAAVAKGGR